MSLLGLLIYLHVAGFGSTWIILMRRTGGDEHMHGLQILAWLGGSLLLSQAWLALWFLAFEEAWPATRRKIL